MQTLNSNSALSVGQTVITQNARGDSPLRARVTKVVNTPTYGLRYHLNRIEEWDQKKKEFVLSEDYCLGIIRRPDEVQVDPA